MKSTNNRQDAKTQRTWEENIECAIEGVAYAATLLIGIVLVATFTGCQSTPDTVAFKTLTATQITAEQALGFWDVYIQEKAGTGNPVRLADEMRVKSAYERYQKAMLVMADAGRKWTQARTLPAVAGGDNPETLRALFTLAIKDADQCKADMLALLETFGVRLAN